MSPSKDVWIRASFDPTQYAVPFAVLSSYFLTLIDYRPMALLLCVASVRFVLLLPTPDKTPLGRLWKKLLLAQLRVLFKGDLRMRRMTRRNQNEMFVARRIVSSSSPEARLNLPPVVDWSTVYNQEALPPLVGSMDEYARGEVIGFCEVTERPFGIVETDAGDTTMTSEPGGFVVRDRPLLTNLSVKKEARKSGIGGRLLEVCERAVMDWDNSVKEMILEVEDDNPNALAFYKKRGYEVVYTDPARRRFTLDGFFLRQERCTKFIMRRSLLGGFRRMFMERAAAMNEGNQASSPWSGILDMGGNVFPKETNQGSP